MKIERLICLLAWMLSCRDKVTVIEPEHIRKELVRITSDIAKNT